MSADNGIYIGKLPNREFRVICTTAIDNLGWKPDGDDGFNSVEVVNYFNTGAKVFSSIEQAMVEALRMEEDYTFWGVLEYGISTIRFPHTIDQYIARSKNK